MESRPIKGERLTTWSVMPGGTQISLDFVAVDGRKHRIVLPVHALSGLMMTLPGILQSALDERFRTVRYVLFSGWGNGNWNGRQAATA